MNDIKTLIQSSIISLVIVILGLFMLCVGRSPQINVDGPLIEADGFNSQSDNLSDEEFLNLLESANDDIFADGDDGAEFGLDSETESFTENTSSDELTEDDDLAELLKMLDMEEDQSTGSEAENVTDDSESLEELFMMEEDQSSSSDFGDLASSDNSGDYNELEALLNDLDADDPLDTDSEWASETTGSGNKTGMTEIESEIARLEQILFDKNTKIDSIQQAIYQYDEKITDLETGAGIPAMGSNGSGSSSIKYASYEQEANSVDESQSIRRNEYSTTSDFNYGSNIQEGYDSALNYFYDRQYETAIDMFTNLLQENPNHSLADNCQYWLGESQFGQGNYFQAIVEFEKIFSYDSADKRDDAQIMMGLAYMKLGENSMALEDFSWLITCYNGSEYSSTARRYMSQL